MIQQFCMCQENLMICRSILTSSTLSVLGNILGCTDLWSTLYFTTHTTVRRTRAIFSSHSAGGFTNTNINENICHFFSLAWLTKRHYLFFFFLWQLLNRTIPNGRKRPYRIINCGLGQGRRVYQSVVRYIGPCGWFGFSDHLANILLTMKQKDFAGDKLNNGDKLTDRAKPFSPKVWLASNISLQYHTCESHIKVMKIKEMITNSRSSWLLAKFSLSAP